MLARALSYVPVFRMHKKGHGDEALRRYRVSIQGCTYFLTLCTKNRAIDLSCSSLAEFLQHEIDLIENDGHWVTRCSVIMPDHLHLLVQITGNLTLSRCIGRLKTKTRAMLLTANLEWQTNFHEHRLRADEPIEPVIRYLFLNPYRQNFLAMDKPYPWFRLCEADSIWFDPTANKGLPFPEWLRP